MIDPKIFTTIGWVLPSVLMVAVAQMFLKAGMDRIGGVVFTLPGIIALTKAVAVNSAVWFGMLLFFMSMAWWLIVLTKLDVSIAYPLVSLGYVVSVIAAYFLFNEPLTSLKIFGLILIFTGVCCIAQS